MKPIALIPVVAFLIGGGPVPPLFAASSNVFSGEVWTWDERASTVTLRQRDGQIVRVKVPPDELGGFRLHERVTLRGQLAPPAEIERIEVPAGPMKPIAQGSPARSEVTGTVASLERAGIVSIAGPGGLLHVWIATPTNGRFRPGTPVRVRTTVQRVQMVPVTGQTDVSPTPSASIGSEPGDYAVVIGRITAIDRHGRITVESPRGPVTIWLPKTLPYGVGQTVEVRTAVHPNR
jgi:hypothetical protein